MKHIFILFLLCAATAVQAQSGFTRNNTVTNNDAANKENNADIIGHIEKTEWVGQKVLFMPIYKNKQQYDYTDFKGGTGFQDRPVYAETVDKIATITSIKDDSGEYKIVLKLDDSSKEYTGTSRNGGFSRMCFYNDLVNAKEKYLNQVYFYKKELLYARDPVTEKITILKNMRFKRVVVTGVYTSFDDNAPIELELQLDGGIKAFININVSNNNTVKSMFNKSTFSEFFFEKNPRELYPWGDAVWKNISQTKVDVNMTEEQVIMSWGKPSEVIQEDAHTKILRYTSGSEVILIDGKVSLKK